jgi:hypothetical protein
VIVQAVGVTVGEPGADVAVGVLGTDVAVGELAMVVAVLVAVAVSEGTGVALAPPGV